MSRIELETGQGRLAGVGMTQRTRVAGNGVAVAGLLVLVTGHPPLFAVLWGVAAGLWLVDLVRPPT